MPRLDDILVCMGRRRSATLREVLAYRNDEVVARFCKMWPVPRPQARRVFGDLLRYLWIASSGEPLTPVLIVDEMWHAFVVYTRDYAAFCDRYFGRMIHHEPTRFAEERAWNRLVRRSPARARASLAKTLEREVALVADRLGKAVMLRWYRAYAKRYNARFFQRSA
ncbi:MAG TPA: hypothetical protein VGI70_01770 [Polyangiales bacterium]|jgi:hypothetical protein